jgi:hypothetical protein
MYSVCAPLAADVTTCPSQPKQVSAIMIIASFPVVPMVDNLRDFDRRAI